MKYTLSLLSLLGLLPLAAQESAPVITVELPRGEQMRFIPVAVSDNANIFSTRAFKVGNGQHSTEPISSVLLSGSLFHAGKWYIPFAETELTCGQYAAVMNLPAPPEKESRLPQTNISVTDVHIFLSKLNALLPGNKAYQESIAPYCNEKSAAPFFRMPTAIEWEYAARGGCEVDEAAFDAETPYIAAGNAAEEYEVFSKASRRLTAPKAVKANRLPNPVGLYDMLGNVSEWVSPIYFFDFRQGRAGGILACGGNFRTTKESLHSSQRSEHAPYRADGTETRSDSVGVRPVLGSVIRHKDMSLEDFEKEWAVFRSELCKPVKNNPTDTTEDLLGGIKEEQQEQMNKLAEQLRQWREEAEEKGIENTALAKRIELLEQQVTRMQTEVDDAGNVVREGQGLKAEAAVVMISTACAHLHEYYLTLVATERKLQEAEDAEERQLYLNIIQTKKYDIEGAKRLLMKGCSLFADVPPAIGDAESRRQLQVLEQENRRQHQATQIGLQYAESLRRSGKFAPYASVRKGLESLK